MRRYEADAGEPGIDLRVPGRRRVNDVGRGRMAVARGKFDPMPGPLDGDPETLGAVERELALTFALERDVARFADADPMLAKDATSKTVTPSA
jgi:hypothetical protein